MTGLTIASGSSGLADTASNATTPIFLSRVQTAMATVALEVQAEAGTVTNDANRKILATRVLTFPGQLPAAFALAVLADLTTLNNASDQDLITRVEAIWDSLAGLG